jgi:hypothetical protein
MATHVGYSDWKYKRRAYSGVWTLSWHGRRAGDRSSACEAEAEEFVYDAF